MTDNTIAATATLLSEVFPESHVVRTEFLSWLYEQSPFGHVIEANLDDERGRIGHYALAPILLATRDGTDRAAALSLNTAVHERARGGGVFVRLASQALADAQGQGIEAVVGVANANSTPGFLHHLGFELLTQLPAKVIVPLPGSGGNVQSDWVGSGAFSPGGLAALSEEFISAPTSGEARRWTLDTLRWRLARPGFHYALHRGDNMLAVSCADRRYTVPVAILLKIFAVDRIPGRVQRALVRAACRFHHAPLALHVGLNETVDFSGVALPRRLRESPLNLIYRSLGASKRPASIVNFEFLDFDAY